MIILVARTIPKTEPLSLFRFLLLQLKLDLLFLSSLFNQAL